MFTEDGDQSKMATNIDVKGSLTDISSQYSSSGTIVELKRSLGLAGGSSVIIGTIIGGDFNRMQRQYLLTIQADCLCMTVCYKVLY